MISNANESETTKTKLNSPPTLLSLSPETLHTITLMASDTLGPPREWRALLCSCQSLRRTLDIPALHALLFASKFQVPAGLLPGEGELYARDELLRRFSALKIFRTRRVEPEVEAEAGDKAQFTDALWVAYVMLKAEEPRRRQRNVEQLVWTGLPALLLDYLRLHLEESRGWPVVNETNSLVVALLWFLSSEECVKAESPKTREEVMARIRPYVLAAFRYPLTPSNRSTDASMPVSVIAATATREVHYFGRRIDVPVPAVPIYAILCYFTRLEVVSPTFPGHIGQKTQTQVQTRGPRREDVEHFINECRTPFEPWDGEALGPRCVGGGGGRARAESVNCDRDVDLTRSLLATYFPGSLSGRWMGSSIIPCINDYRHWMNNPEAPAPESMEMFCRQPLYLTLQEHFCFKKSVNGGHGQAIEDELPETWVEREAGRVHSSSMVR
ncbi:hypothetical protein MKEN_01147500 [Mycena kentingensis (nom. inval.)]|nr:hypothetical protein MKEN_01147500 [Mycena kentingensis (nom. inval.)]